VEGQPVRQTFPLKLPTVQYVESLIEPLVPLLSLPLIIAEASPKRDPPACKNVKKLNHLQFMFDNAA
jgi:hypothetical protein